MALRIPLTLQESLPAAKLMMGLTTSNKREMKHCLHLIYRAHGFGQDAGNPSLGPQGCGWKLYYNSEEEVSTSMDTALWSPQIDLLLLPLSIQFIPWETRELRSLLLPSIQSRYPGQHAGGEDEEWKDKEEVPCTGVTQKAVHMDMTETWGSGLEGHPLFAKRQRTNGAGGTFPQM